MSIANLLLLESNQRLLDSLLHLNYFVYFFLPSYFVHCSYFPIFQSSSFPNSVPCSFIPTVSRHMSKFPTIITVLSLSPVHVYGIGVPLGKLYPLLGVYCYDLSYELKLYLDKDLRKDKGCYRSGKA